MVATISRVPADEFAGFTVDVDVGVMTIRLDRPDAGNALQSAAIAQLGMIFGDISDRDDVRVVLICAAGPSFSVGGDVKAFASTITQTPQ